MRTRRRLVTIGGLSAMLLVVASAFAMASWQRSTTGRHGGAKFGTWSCTHGSVTLTADADAYVDQLNPTSNFGTNPQLIVQPTSGKIKRVFVHFPAPTIPSGCTVTGATLSLTQDSALPFTTGRTLVAAAASASWTELGITAANQPTVGSGVSAACCTQGQTVSWSVGTYQANGWRVADSGEGTGTNLQNVLKSREAATPRPTLVVTY